MKKVSILVGLMVLVFAVNAQSTLPKPLADSLLQVWNDPAQPDSSRANAFSKSNWDGYLFSQPDSAFMFAQQLTAFARTHSLPKFVADGLNQQGVCLSLLGESKEALPYFFESLE